MRKGYYALLLCVLVLGVVLGCYASVARLTDYNVMAGWYAYDN